MSEVTLESCIFHGNKCHITPDSIRKLVERYGLVMVDRELIVLWLELYDKEVRYPAAWLKRAIEFSYSPQIPHAEYVKDKQGKMRQARGLAKEKAMKEAYARLDEERAAARAAECPPEKSEFWKFVPKAVKEKWAAK
ncbi:hypothetical protein [Selenomonas ruminantium]|uniref:Uncharacterized protein n=1 Tax=Selenomonas ruminantium TaxID=971 RepID=A0A1H0SJR9_SELRU|nr:hypothetical protein [Selenomonas ruminantium]SDP42021.1 hypothetical protein SAMN05216366_11824 [Selenomonas ruminantium]